MTTQKLARAVVAIAGPALLLTGCASTEANDYDSLGAIREDIEQAGMPCDLYDEYDLDNPSDHGPYEIAWCQSSDGSTVTASRFVDADYKQSFVDALRVDEDEDTDTYNAIDGTDWVIECSVDTDECEAIAEQTNAEMITFSAEELETE